MHWRSSYLIGGELELAEKYSDGLREMLADNKGDLAVTREDARDRLTSAESEIESSSLKR
jgi:hypothetical protein